jgi:lipopolysaccharide assembly protein A
MLISLLVGIVLGGLTVIFALQNVAMVTVNLWMWQFSAPLAIVLLGTVMSGIIITLLILLPTMIREELYVKTLKRQKREIEDELAEKRVEGKEIKRPSIHDEYSQRHDVPHSERDVFA